MVAVTCDTEPSEVTLEPVTSAVDDVEDSSTSVIKEETPDEGLWHFPGCCHSLLGQGCLCPAANVCNSPVYAASGVYPP